LYNAYEKYIIYVEIVGVDIMGRPRTNNVQINIAIPSEWKKELENLARIYSVEEGKTITFLDLMRRGIQEKYQLKDVNDHEE
jgi:hypothetical protein